MEYLIDVNTLIAIFIVVEIVLFSGLIAALILFRVWLFYRDRWVQKTKQKISNELLACMKGEKHFRSWRIPLCFRYSYILLPVMESYDRSFKGGEWEKLKKKISDRVLLPKARRRAKSRDWLKRNFAARCFALTPCKSDEKIILNLIDDPVFLVRSVASIAAVALPNKNGVYKIIQHISKEHGYARYFYRDVLFHGESAEIYAWINEFASKKTDKAVHLTCLDLLSAKIMTLKLPNILDDLNSEDSKVRLAAVKVFSRNPQIESGELLPNFLNDPEEDIRAEAVKGLESFATEENRKKIENALQDPSWKVRLQAAKSLKAMGMTGIEILNKQDPAKDKNAFEAALYALQFE